ncbi:MAG: hypothetical protein ACLFU9_00290 [Candidatus Bathyarchaeia archaeon]
MSDRTPEKWEIWMDILILKACTQPSIVGASEHFLLAARRILVRTM